MAFTGSQNLALLVLLVAVFNTRYHVSSQSLAPGFYSTTCPTAESIITATVTNHVRAKADNAPGLLRMFFHDCFVQGCDGSILIDGPSTEKTAGPNTLLRGFDVIDDAKSQIEAVCPGVVSCADILAIAARDCVVLTGGPFWRVPTGRRDGTVSSASDTSNLPAFRDSMDVQLRKFQDKGLSIQDLVTLVGGHTIGTSQCQFFTYRLANFNGTTSPDPSLNPAFIQEFQNFCNGNATRRMDLDRGSGNRFDTSFYGNVNRGVGVLESDQKLWTDPRTRVFVQRLLGLSGLLGLRFTVEFPSAMIRMGNIEVKTGSQGEIRRVCTRVN